VERVVERQNLSVCEVELLREVFPHARLGPPATEAQIVGVEAVLGVRLPDQLRELYLTCDGCREDRGNAKYLLALTDEDFIGSLLSITRQMWTERTTPDLRPFIFFGSSSGDEWWGISWQGPARIIAYHHLMEDQYEVVGSKIIEVYRADYAKYDQLG
jgi:hypothetical protein